MTFCNPSVAFLIPSKLIFLTIDDKSSIKDDLLLRYLSHAFSSSPYSEYTSYKNEDELHGTNIETTIKVANELFKNIRIKSQKRKELSPNA